LKSRCKKYGHLSGAMNRTVNGTFASGAPARNSRTVGFGFLLKASRGLTRLVNGRKK
jgi:hypothetical protein